MATGIMSPAATDLGLGGSDLSQQVKDESEDERKKRLLANKTSQLSPGASALLGGPGAGLNSGGI